MWLWGTTIDRAVSAASQGSMYAKFEESEKEKAAKPKPSPWVTIGNVAAEVPMSSAGMFDPIQSDKIIIIPVIQFLER